MAKLSLVKGTTSYRAYIFVQDSSVTTGAGKTGLAFNTASLTAYYVRPGATATAITLATQTVTGAYSSGGFVEVDATNMPGLYRLDVPDAALASGVNAVVVMLKGAANMVPVLMEIELTGIDNQDAVRAGLTALPNVASGSAGAIPTTGTGANQLNVSGGRADANVLRWNGTAVPAEDTAGYPKVTIKDGTGAGEIDTTSGGVLVAAYASGQAPLQPTVAGRTLDVSTGGEAGLDWANVGSPTTANNLSGTNIKTDQVVASVTGAVGSVTAGVTVTTNNDKTGYGLSAAAVQAIWDALTSALTTVGSIGKRLADDIDATISSRSTYAGGDTSGITTLLARIASALTITGGKVDVNDKTGFSLSAAGVQAVWDALTSALTTVGSIGKRISDFLTGDSFVRLGAPVGASISADVAAVQADTDNMQTRLPAALVSGRMDASVGAIAANAITAASLAADASAEIADQVWDEAIAGHLTGGSTGAALSAASSAGDPWGTALPGAYGAGTAGKIVGDNINATISSRATPAQVNTEVVDALTVDTYAEMGSVPAATSSLKDKIGWLFMLARNKRTTTSTSDVVRNDGDAATIGASTISDDGTTFTRGKYS